MNCYVEMIPLGMGGHLKPLPIWCYLGNEFLYRFVREKRQTLRRGHTHASADCRQNLTQFVHQQVHAGASAATAEQVEREEHGTSFHDRRDIWPHTDLPSGGNDLWFSIGIPFRTVSPSLLAPKL